MYEYCLGINPDLDKPGFQKVIFAPYFDLTGKITEVKGHYDTDYGRISVEWQNNQGIFEYKASVPVEIACEFAFPGMKVLRNSVVNKRHTFHLSIDA